VSETVHHQVTDKVDFDFQDLGPQSLKNIARPTGVYRMAGEMAELSEALVAAAMVTAAPAFDDRRAIAVVPFADFSGDPEQEFFADGIHRGHHFDARRLARFSRHRAQFDLHLPK
jgi:adenylate cyclase